MSLAEKLSATPRTDSGLPCGVAKLLSLIEGEDLEALELLMSQPSSATTVSNRQIHDILLSEGYDVAFSSISTHRRRQCRCFTGMNSVARRDLKKKAS